MLRPVVSKVSEQQTNVDFYYVDVDQAPEIADKFGVRSIPTLVLIKEGKEVNRTVGYMPESEVTKFALS